MFYLRSKGGKHTVTFNGSTEEFGSLREAFKFIANMLGGTI